jgi:hypothetical protein
MSRARRPIADPNDKTANAAFTQREARRTAYLPVRIRKYKWFPFLAVDCQLVDLTPSGAKLQCGRNLYAKQGDSFWIEIPPVSSSINVKLLLAAECRWYKDDLSLGAAFRAVSSEEQGILQAVVDYLKKSGRLKA